MGLDNQDVERLVSELHQLRLTLDRQSQTSKQLEDIKRVLEDIKSNMNSGGGD